MNSLRKLKKFQFYEKRISVLGEMGIPEKSFQIHLGQRVFLQPILSNHQPKGS